MSEPSGNYHDAWWEAESQLVLLRNDRDEMLEILANLSHTTGQYIETDERPRPVHLWAAMMDAQQLAAVYLNARSQ